MCVHLCFFFFNDTATTEIYTLSLHDALPIFRFRRDLRLELAREALLLVLHVVLRAVREDDRHRLLVLRLGGAVRRPLDRKSTRLNSSHANISYAVFCLKKKKRDYIAYSNTLS